MLWNTRRLFKDPLPFHRENFNRLGNTFALTPGLGTVVNFTRDHKLARYMLQKNQRNFHKSDLQTQDLAKYIGHGLLTSNADKWRKNRKVIQPAFYKKQLAEVVDTMASAVRYRLREIHPGTQDVFPVMNELAFQVVARSLFNLKDTDEDMKQLQTITESAQKMLVKEMRLQWLKWYFERESLSRKQSIPYHLRQVEKARNILLELIRQRKESADSGPSDLLDMLLAAKYDDGSGMDEQQLIDELLVIFTAGHETTANALSFAIQLLGMHPEIQERARAEAFDSSKLTGEQLMKAIQESSFIQQCIEETMRLYPPAYFTDRKPVEEDEFQGILIPKGGIWLISFYEIHRRKDLWEAPDEFRPERFADGRARELTDRYFPFGAGPRMCIGNNFAMFEMVLVLAHLLKHYRWTTRDKNVQYRPLITLKPRNAVVDFTAIK